MTVSADRLDRAERLIHATAANTVQVTVVFLAGREWAKRSRKRRKMSKKYHWRAQAVVAVAIIGA